MALPRASRARLVWALELSLGLELYACAVLALHARGLRATPLEASPALVLPALVIPPVFYVLVALVIVRPLALPPLVVAAATMSGIHGVLVVATGALFMIPDLVDFGAAVAFALWGSPTVTLLQLTAAPLVFARLRPLVSAPHPPRVDTRAAAARRRVEPASAGPRPVSTREAPAPSFRPSAPTSTGPAQGEIRPSPPVPPPAFVSPLRSTAGHSAPSAPAPGQAPVVIVRPAGSSAPPVAGPPVVNASPSLAPVAANSPAVAPAEPRVAEAPSSRALDWSEPTIRVSFVRIADQLPVEMFARGAEGLKDTMRPGVSLLVPQKLLLPHLSEGLAPVRWEVVADQFPLDELAMTHEEIADRLPDGALLLPLDEVIPQIPPALLTLSTAPVDVQRIEEFPEPFQPQAPEPAPPEAFDRVSADQTAPVDEPTEEIEAEVVAEVSARQAAPPERDEPETAAAQPVAPALQIPAEVDRSADGGQARRIAALLTPLLNGLEIGRRDGAGATLVTVIAPTLSEDSVVRTALRLVPFLRDARLPEPVTQATLTAGGATVVLTPFGSPDGGGALLVTAVASRAALAWLERLLRTAAREAQVETINGQPARSEHGAGEELELRPAGVPPGVRELADSLTAFGSVAPTVLRDGSGALRACLFLPSSLDAFRLARFARDLHDALDGAEIGRIASVMLKLRTHRVVLRAMDDAAGHATMLVGAGRIDRPGLARIELDRAAMRLGALVGG